MAARARPSVRTLDATLPQFDVHEVHSIVLPCSPERALELALWRLLLRTEWSRRCSGYVGCGMGRRSRASSREWASRPSSPRPRTPRRRTPDHGRPRPSWWSPLAAPRGGFEVGSGRSPTPVPAWCAWQPTSERSRPREAAFSRRDARAGRRCRGTARLPPLLARRRPVLGRDQAPLAAGRRPRRPLTHGLREDDGSWHARGVSGDIPEVRYARSGDALSRTGSSARARSISSSSGLPRTWTSVGGARLSPLLRPPRRVQPRDPLRQAGHGDVRSGAGGERSRSGWTTSAP